MKQVRKVLCLLLSVAICFVATGCNMSLYNEVMVSEDFVEGDPTTVQVESQVEKTVEKEIDVYVEGTPDNNGVVNDPDDTLNDDDDSGTEVVDKFIQSYLDRTQKNLSSEAYKNKLNDIGFGFFHTQLNEWGNSVITSDYVNTLVSVAIDDLPTIKKYNCKGWIGVSNIYKAVIQALSTGSTGWQDTFDKLNQSIIDSGAEDACLGWYLDEPSQMPALKMISEYAQKYGRRFFVCFDVQTISPRSYGGFRGEEWHTSREYTQYLTDVGFDCYWSVKANKKMFDNMIEDMHNTCPEDAYIWYIPGTYSSNRENATPTEVQKGNDGMSANLYAFYDFLLEEKKPGGLLCFTGDVFLRGEKLYGIRQINEQTNNGYAPLLEELEKVGREICRTQRK